MFIRHAEKQNDGTSNPHLSDAGHKRAEKWAAILEHVEIDLVYSTDYFRTVETAAPIAELLGVSIQLYDPRIINLPELVAQTKGKKVLVVGHSNTTPSYVNALLGKEKYEQIPKAVYGHLYLVHISKETISDILLNF